MCYGSWGCNELDTTEWLNRNASWFTILCLFQVYSKMIQLYIYLFFFRFFSRTGYQSSSVQFSCSVMSNSLQPHGLQHARLPCPSPTARVYSNSCPSHWWCHPTISSSGVPFSSLLQSFPSIRVFSNESALRIRWLKYWSFSFSISPSNEHPGLISFRMDWLDLLAVQGTFKSVLQHHSSKPSILWRSS